MAAVLLEWQPAGEGETKAVASALLRAALEYADKVTHANLGMYSGKRQAILAELEKHVRQELCD